jgi:OOP family OmpA-OmpF porin
VLGVRAVKSIAPALLSALCLSTAVLAADAPGCKDSPYIPRFPGATLNQCSDKIDDLVTFPGQKPLEGEVHESNYTFPATISRVEVYRNVKTALEKAGFKIVFDTSPGNGDFVAQLGKVWIFEQGHGESYHQTVALETKLEQRMTANANGHYAAIAEVAAAGKDAPGCTDSPLVQRFPKSVLSNCSDKPDDTAEIPVGTEVKRIEGEVHRATYDYPPTSSKAQVYRNLKTALLTAGFTLVRDTSQSVGDLTVHSGKSWVLIETTNASYHQTIVVETELTQDVTANADALYGGLAKNGHVAVYGILFDTGKADLKPSSSAALKEIVGVLKKDPKLKLFVVGHTDNVGDVPSNLDLSRRRAAAVVHALVTDYGIAAGVLDSFGSGPYSPVTSNDKEEHGRAFNRRVELVKQ